MTGRPACEEVRQATGEIALGVVVGAERSAMLAHLDGCDDCRTELRRYCAAVDAVLQLAPEADPPAGFEVRFLARRDLDRRPQAERRRLRARPAAALWSRAGGARKAMLGLAAALLLAAGVGLGSLAFSGGSSPAHPMRSAALSYDGKALGDVTVVSGIPAWMFMTLDATGWSGRVRCVVSEQGGREVTVGSFSLRHGAGGWAARLPVPARMVRSASIETMSGTMLATAVLPA